MTAQSEYAVSCRHVFIVFHPFVSFCQNFAEYQRCNVVISSVSQLVSSRYVASCVAQPLISNDPHSPFGFAVILLKFCGGVLGLLTLKCAYFTVKVERPPSQSANQPTHQLAKQTVVRHPVWYFVYFVCCHLCMLQLSLHAGTYLPGL